MLDFSYSRADLVRMEEKCDTESDPSGPRGKLVVLDHRISAQKELGDLPFCTFNMNKSGAVLAWEHFHGIKVDKETLDKALRGPGSNRGWNAIADKIESKRQMHELFRYIQDRDLWRWELPNSREISTALAVSGALQDFRALIDIYRGWDMFDASDDRTDGPILKETLVIRGDAILRAERQMVERAVATAEEVEIRYPDPNGSSSWASIRALAVSTMSLQSEIGEALALDSARRGRDAVGIVYYKDGPSGKWRVSLRSRSTAECPEDEKGAPRRLPPSPRASAAEGTPRRAGFEVSVLPWRYIDTKCTVEDCGKPTFATSTNRCLEHLTVPFKKP